MHTTLSSETTVKVGCCEYSSNPEAYHATDEALDLLLIYMQKCCMAKGWYQLWSKWSTAFFFLWRSVRVKYWRTGRAPEGKLASTLAKVVTSGVGMVASEISTECLGTPEPPKNWHLADVH